MTSQIATSSTDTPKVDVSSLGKRKQSDTETLDNAEKKAKSLPVDEEKEKPLTEREKRLARLKGLPTMSVEQARAFLKAHPDLLPTLKQFEESTTSNPGFLERVECDGCKERIREQAYSRHDYDDSIDDEPYVLVICPACKKGWCAQCSQEAVPESDPDFETQNFKMSPDFFPRPCIQHASDKCLGKDGCDDICYCSYVYAGHGDWICKPCFEAMTKDGKTQECKRPCVNPDCHDYGRYFDCKERKQCSLCQRFACTVYQCGDKTHEGKECPFYKNRDLCPGCLDDHHIERRRKQIEEEAEERRDIPSVLAAPLTTVVQQTTTGVISS